MNMPGFSGMQYNGGACSPTATCDGICRCYFDDGYLPSDADRPQNSEVVNDRTGSGPVTGSGDNNGVQCYSYTNYVDPTSQTQVSNNRHCILFDCQIFFSILGTLDFFVD